MAEKNNPADAVRRAIQDSGLIKSIAATRDAAARPSGYRALTAAEIRTLEGQHNAAEDWARVTVKEGFNPHKVVGCYFSKDVRLGTFREKVTLEKGVEIGSGIYNSDLNNVSVGDNAFVSNNSLIANYSIGAGAIVQGCGSVVCAGETTFGNGRKVSLGLEVAGRDTSFFAEITVDVAARAASARKNSQLLHEFEEAVGEYLRLVSSKLGVIETGATVQNTPKVIDTFVGSHAVVDAATWVENVTVLSSHQEPVRIASGACVKDSIVQWGSRIETHAVVDGSVCCEHSFVADHGRLNHSLLGPNSGVSCGECTHSLVGPFVGFHHQSLLIAAYWPEGKGNIGYGANIGSNHTGKAPDQEIWPGEGTFFGLGVNIKFPADFSKAPYSIIATGVSTLPMRVEMPFSLINARAESIDGVSPAYNEILPGWVLADNIYMVRRNERKYATRNQARRSNFEYEVFRPEIVDMMVRARAALEKAGGTVTPARATQKKSGHPVDAAHRPVYTDKDIPGLGKNFMKETARLEGIQAYQFYIRFYALKGLYFGVRFCLQHNRDIKRLLEKGFIGDPRYVHELSMLNAEFPGKKVPELLKELIDAYEKVAADTLLSKEKDDFRGVRIIPDYADVHVSAKDDVFVKATQQEATELKFEVESILKRL